jgi:hypothetical protein
MSEDKPEQIKGAKLVEGVWRDLDGNPLTNADLMRLRAEQESEREQRRKDRAKKEGSAG